MEKTTTFVKINKYVQIKGGKAVDKYFDNPDGNLYYREKGSKGPFQICDGFDAMDIKIQVVYANWEVIFVEGPSLSIMEVA